MNRINMTLGFEFKISPMINPIMDFLASHFGKSFIRILKLILGMPFGTGF